jgi:hypothetical protein
MRTRGQEGDADVDQAIKQVIKEADARAKPQAAKPAQRARSAPGIRIPAASRPRATRMRWARCSRTGRSTSGQLQQLGPKATRRPSRGAQRRHRRRDRRARALQGRPRRGIPAAPCDAPAAVPRPLRAAGVPPPRAAAPMPGPGPTSTPRAPTLEQAKANLLTYSPRKQAQDPQGFAAAKRRSRRRSSAPPQAEAAWQVSRWARCRRRHRPSRPAPVRRSMSPNEAQAFLDALDAGNAPPPKAPPKPPACAAHDRRHGHQGRAGRGRPRPVGRGRRSLATGGLPARHARDRLRPGAHEPDDGRVPEPAQREAERRCRAPTASSTR